MSNNTEIDNEDEEVQCFKCGGVVAMDNVDDFSEPLCFGCSHGQNEINDQGDPGVLPLP